MKKIYDKRKIRKALDIDIYPRGGGKIDLRVLADTADSVSLGSEAQSEAVSNDSTIFGDSDAYVAIITNPDAQDYEYEYEYINVNDFYEFEDGIPVNVKSGLLDENSRIVGIVYKSSTDLNGTYKIGSVTPIGQDLGIVMSRRWTLSEDGYYVPSGSPSGSGEIKPQ